MKQITSGENKGYILQTKEVVEKLKKHLNIKGKIIKIESYDSKAICVTFIKTPHYFHDHLYIGKKEFCGMFGIDYNEFIIKIVGETPEKGKFIIRVGNELFTDKDYVFIETIKPNYVYITEVKNE